MGLKGANPSVRRRDARGKDAAAGVAASVESWTVEIPFQHVFVEACAYEEKLQPETAMDVVEDELRALCRVRVREALCCDSRTMRDVSVWRLRATCPFCEAGRDQILDSRNWVYVHDWWREEIDATAQSEDTYIQEHAMEVRFVTGDTTPAKLLLDAFFLEAIEKWGESGILPTPRKRNAYGISLATTRKSIDGQLGLHMPEVGFRSVTYGIEGYFGGLYRCPHCGGVFAVVYRDEQQRRRLGKYELLSYYNEGIDELIGVSERRRRCMASPSNPLGLLPTMAAHVERSGGAVSLEANIAGRRHRFELNTENGSFLLDGSTYVRGYFRVGEFLENPLVDSGIFGSRELVELLKGLLPGFPRGVEFDFESNRGLRNLHTLISANRFVSYPSSFYDASDPIVSMQEIYPLGLGLPRDYSDVPALYEMTGLPEKKSLKRVLYTRPKLLFALLNAPELPFGNVDVLRRFLELREAETLLPILNLRPRSCAGWRWLVSAKGEKVVLDYLTSNTPDAIADMSHLLDGAIGELEDVVRDCVARASMGDVKKILACQEWQNEHPEMDLDAPYAYDNFAEGLELDGGKYAFVLPRNPRDFVLASIELKNCLNTLAFLSSKPEGAVIVLVKEGEKFVAGIRVGRDGRVVTALAKCNKPIRECSKLNTAVEKWMERKSLLLAIDDEYGICAF